jgi:hypothetical protein
MKRLSWSYYGLLTAPLDSLLELSSAKLQPDRLTTDQ